MATAANIVFGGVAVTIGSDLGYIKDGVTITPSFEIYKPSGIEGLMTAPKSRRISEEYTVTFNLIEPTLANIRLWIDSTNTITAGPPATLEVGADSATPNEQVLVVTSIEPGGTDVRTITFHKVVAEGAGEWKLTDFEEGTLPCSFVTLYDVTTDELFLVSDA